MQFGSRSRIKILSIALSAICALAAPTPQLGLNEWEKALDPAFTVTEFFGDRAQQGSELWHNNASSSTHLHGQDISNPNHHGHFPGLQDRLRYLHEQMESDYYENGTLPNTVSTGPNMPLDTHRVHSASAIDTDSSWLNLYLQNHQNVPSGSVTGDPWTGNPTPLEQAQAQQLISTASGSQGVETKVKKLWSYVDDPDLKKAKISNFDKEENPMLSVETLDGKIETVRL